MDLIHHATAYMWSNSKPEFLLGVGKCRVFWTTFANWKLETRLEIAQSIYVLQAQIRHFENRNDGAVQPFRLKASSNFWRHFLNRDHVIQGMFKHNFRQYLLWAKLSLKHSRLWTRLNNTALNSWTFDFITLRHTNTLANLRYCMLLIYVSSIKATNYHSLEFSPKMQ